MASVQIGSKNMKKISVMIVDDEKLVLEDLMTIVDWDTLGFEIVATAMNGKQALSKFEQYHPQVVFTDIKMPFMDGIELIKQLRKIDTQTQILLLTAYEDFSYAKSAIQYGITDYIIKSTINNQTVLSLLHRIRTTIDNQGKVLDILKEKEIENFFVSNSELEQISDKELFTTPYCYLIVEQDMPINLAGDNSIDAIRYQKADAVSILLEGENTGYEIVAFSSTPREQMLLVFDIPGTSKAAFYQTLLQYARNKKDRLKEKLQLDFTFYMMSNKVNLIELKRRYSSYSQSFYRKYLLESKRVIDFADNRSTAVPEAEEVSLDMEHIRGLLEKRDEQGIQVYLEELFPAICTSGSYKNLCSVSRELYDLLKRNNKHLPEYARKLNLSFADNWRNWLSAKQLREWFAENFLELIHEKQKEDQNQYSKPIVLAMDYIYHHYSNMVLGINDVADHANLSTGHLCVLFKKETGKTLNNYISEVRIAEAKRLLNENKLKVYKISEAVGFQSSQYFSQVFYKLVGMTPNEYQKGKRQTQVTASEKQI